MCNLYRSQNLHNVECGFTVPKRFSVYVSSVGMAFWINIDALDLKPQTTCLLPNHVHTNMTTNTDLVDILLQPINIKSSCSSRYSWMSSTHPFSGVTDHAMLPRACLAWDAVTLAVSRRVAVLMLGSRRRGILYPSLLLPKSWDSFIGDIDDIRQDMWNS